jgi:hypothetical protein
MADNIISSNNNEPQSVSDGEKLHENDATTGFTADANVAKVEPVAISKMDSLLYASSTTNFYQDITTFLEKPVVLQAGFLSTTDVVGTNLMAKNLPQDGFVTSPIYLDKLKGFLGWRGDIEIRWQINGNRFQQGRYMMVWVPTGGSPTQTVGTGLMLAAHTNTLVQRTQLFRVELDVNCDTEGQMCIPYTSSMNFVPLASIPGNSGVVPYLGMLGQLLLYPYSPLVAPAGSNTVAYTVWISFKDNQFIGPTVPQSAKMFKSSKRGKSSTEIEQQKANIGPIQSAMIKISSATSYLSPVPMIRDYAQGLGWAADVVGNVASVFGWSKPLNLAPIHRVHRAVLPWFGNVDAADQSEPLSLSAKNQVAVMPGFSGTDVDELAFSSFVTIPAWVQTVTWSESATAGTSLVQFNNTPISFLQNRVTASGDTITDFTPLAFVANYFTQWRGSIVYTIRFVKTEFHSGRLCVAFQPIEYYNGSGPPSGLPFTPYLHREIIDIRECNEVSFTVPYLSSSPYRTTHGAQTSTGAFLVYVVDPLVAPATVSPNVTMLFEVSGGADVQFAIPYASPLTLYTGAVPQSGRMFGQPKPQADNCELVSGTLGSSTVLPGGTLNEEACIGEHVSSFRTLLKMTNVLPPYSVAQTPAKYAVIAPFAIPFVNLQGTTATNTNTIGDLYSVLASIFVYSRGGVRIKFLDQVLATDTQPYVTYYNSLVQTVGSVTDFYVAANTNGLAQTNYSGRTCAPQVYHQEVNNMASEVQCPQYHAWHSRVNSEHLAGVIAGPATTYNLSVSSLATRYVISHHYPVTAIATTPCRAASDDTNFGLFVSIPPMIQKNGVGTE